jgi:2-polyprenyl-3-methyl-5-hydroxy-6-metoxy-1,4-benzoquinol methylase
MKCLFCESSDFSESYLPSTLFNQKRFDYLTCQDCKLINIHPIPNQADLLKMYPSSYQAGIDATILVDPYKKLIGLRFSYGYQFDLLEKIGFTEKMIDFGCGAANFLINANHAGFACDGVEFNSEHVAILKTKIPTSNFYTVNEFEQSPKKVDLIRLSNVFEHFTNPKEQMLSLKNKLKSDGYFLIEGPIEYNFNFALQFRKLYFSLRKKLNKSYVADHTPTHIIFSNLKNQLQFFENLGLKKVHIEVCEAEWPFPPSFKSAKGTVSKINVIIARASIFLRKLNKNWGNTFIYIGKV